MKKTILASILVTGLSASAAEYRYAESHVHGINNVKMILSNNYLHVTYKMPIIQLENEKHHEKHKDGFFCFF